MVLYNQPLEPSVQLSVITNSTAISAVGAFNTVYFLGYPGVLSDLESYKPELITSLSDYENRIGGVPTTRLELVNYLSIAAIFANLKGTGLVRYIAVRPPFSTYTLSIASAQSPGQVVNYLFTINGIEISGSVLVPNATVDTSAFLAGAIANKIQNTFTLSSSVYIRSVTGSVIEIVPFASGQMLSFAFLPAVGPNPLLTANYTLAIGVPAYSVPTQQDYSQALSVSLTKEDNLGVIIAPGFYYQATKVEAFNFTKLADTFCKKSEQQHIFIADVVNPELKYADVYAGVSSYIDGQELAANLLIEYKGSIYSGNGLVATPNYIPAEIVAVGVRVRLLTPVKIAGLTGIVLQSINVAATLSATPTPLELSRFVVIPTQQLISEFLINGTLTVIEKSSSTEQNLYDYRDDFDSAEGHVSMVAPYQNYIGPEVFSKFYLPASSYQAALWIYVSNTFSLATPPASDDFPLEATDGGYWQVTGPGHAVLNGKGINIIKSLNGLQYIMGSRTLSKLDIYNRQNARAILSLYVRSLKAVLNRGLTLKPLTSTGVFLSALETKADNLSRAFFRAGLLDGVSESDAFINTANNLILNPIVNLQQGLIKVESRITQIGMTEKISITVQQSLLGTGP